MRLTLNTAQLVKEYGGPSQMSRYCTERGYPISKQGVSRWVRDEIIPMGAWLELYAIEMKIGRRIDLRKYIVITKGKA